MGVNGNRGEEQELWPGVPVFFSASRNSRMKENQNYTCLVTSHVHVKYLV